MIAEIFAHIGFGQWFRYVINIVELGGGIWFVDAKDCVLWRAVDARDDGLRCSNSGQQQYYGNRTKFNGKTILTA